MNIIQDMIGQKQYAITYHLGNVLSTVSDQHLGRDINGDSVIDYYNAVIPAAYDYYPFGMLMPFRYTQDNSTHCATIILRVMAIKDIQRHNKHLLIYNILGVLLSILIGMANDIGGAGFAYSIVSLSVVGLISFLYLFTVTVVYRKLYFENVRAKLYVIVIFAINVWEFLLIFKLALFE